MSGSIGAESEASCVSETSLTANRLSGDTARTLGLPRISLTLRVWLPQRRGRTVSGSKDRYGALSLLPNKIVGPLPITSTAANASPDRRGRYDTLGSTIGSQSR
jgi:hypothetical protein